MTPLEPTFGTADPAIAKMLREANAMPAHSADRLELEAALCQWWANRCLLEAGELRGWSKARRRTRATS